MGYTNMATFQAAGTVYCTASIKWDLILSTEGLLLMAEPEEVRLSAAMVELSRYLNGDNTDALQLASDTETRWRTRSFKILSNQRLN